MSQVATHVARVRERMAEAALRAAREPSSVSLCAVTKYADLGEIREAVEAGCDRLGESRVQVAEEKVEGGADFRKLVSWELIGHLQGNKARRAVQIFDRIQSLDSLRLARRLSGIAVEENVTVRALVEVHTSGEDSKGGIALEAAPEVLAEIQELPGLAVEGLMTMAPFVDDEAVIRGCFSALRELRDRLGGEKRLPELSMGMTHDFEWAIEEGATVVRVGTALFG